MKEKLGKQEVHVFKMQSAGFCSVLNLWPGRAIEAVKYGEGYKFILHLGNVSDLLLCLAPLGIL